MSKHDIPNPMHGDNSREAQKPSEELFQNERLAMRPSDSAAAASQEPGSRPYDIQTCKQLIGLKPDGSNEVDPAKFALIKGFVKLAEATTFNGDDMKQVANRLSDLGMAQKNPHARYGLMTLAGHIEQRHAS